MLDTTELRTLARWCRGRGLRFLPLGTDAACSVILFERLEPTRPWQRMKLVQDDTGFRLCDESDDLLASGSDLPAIFWTRWTAAWPNRLENAGVTFARGCL